MKPFFYIYVCLWLFHEDRCTDSYFFLHHMERYKHDTQPHYSHFIRKMKNLIQRLTSSVVMYKIPDLNTQD